MQHLPPVRSTNVAWLSELHPLQPEDRITLASLNQQSYSIRAMARLLERPASTISRELQRNSCKRSKILLMALTDVASENVR